MPAAARIGDLIEHIPLVPCGKVDEQVMPGPCPGCASNPVSIEGMPAAHVDCTCVCGFHPSPVPPPFKIGSISVSIHGKPALRWTPSVDLATCGAFVGDPLLAWTRTVFIGDIGMGGSGCPDGL